LGRFFGFLLILVIAVFVAFQIPEVQTRAARFAAAKVSKVLGTDISIERLRLSLFKALVIKNIAVVDKAPYTEDRYKKGWAPADTLFKASSISASFTLSTLFQKKSIHLHKATVKDGYLHIVSEPDGYYKSNIQRMFRLQKKEEKNMADIFSIDNVSVSDFRFRLNSFLDKHPKSHESGCNYSDLDLTANIKVKALHMAGGKMSGTLIHLDAKEKGGLDVKDIHGSAVVGGGKVVVPELYIKDSFSEVSMKGFSMTFTTNPPFYNLVNTVIFESTFKPSSLDVRTITAACGALYGNDLLFDIRSGYVKGKVNDLNVVGLDFTEKVSGLEGSVSASLVGTTSIRTSRLTAHVNNARFDTDQLSEFLNRWAKNKKLNLGKLAHGKPLEVDAVARGPLNSMTAECVVSSAFGGAQAQMKFGNLLVREKKISMCGTLKTDNLDLGTVIGKDIVGKCTMHAVLDSRLGGQDGLSAKLDTIDIRHIECKGHDFKDISGNIDYDGGFVAGHINCNDDILKLKLGTNMHIGGSEKIGPGKLSLDIPFADLETLNFWDTEGPAKLRTGISVAMTSGINEDGESAIYVRELHLDDGNGWKDMGELAVGATTESGRQNIAIYSSFANAQFDGEGLFRDMVSYLKYAVTGKYLPSLSKEPPKEVTPANYDVKLNVSGVSSLLKILSPDLYIADNTSMALNIDRSGRIKASLFSPRFAKGLNMVKNTGLEITGDSESLNCSLVSNEMKFGSVNIRNGVGQICARNDTIGVNLRYSGLKSEGNSGVLNVNCGISRDPAGTMMLTFDPGGTGLTFGRYTWGIGDSQISLKGKDIRFDNFNLGYDESHYLSINGGLSKENRDTLNLDVRNLELGFISEFLGKDFNLGGELKGNASLYTPMNERFGLEMVLSCDSLSVGGAKKSRLEASSRWNPETGRMDILVTNRLGVKSPLRLSGSYNPRDKDLHAGIALDGFDIKHCEPFARKLFKSLGGTIDGTIKADGTPDKLVIGSNGLSFKDATMHLKFNDVSYTIDGPVRADEKHISLDGLTVKDSFGGSGFIKGSIFHNRFKDIRLKCGLYADNLKALDIKEKDSQGLYGSLAINGIAGVEGPLNAIAVNADLSTSGDGSIHIPLPSSLSATSSNLLTFTAPKVETDPYDEMVKAMKKNDQKKKGKFTARANLKITPQVTANVEIDKESGHVLSASGDGDLTLDFDPSKDRFTLDGDYEIQKGSYHFEIPGIVSRDFSIVQGSTLNFGGPLMNASMNINATHNVKTSLSTLISDVETTSRRNVICGINISSRLKKPEIGFSVEVPDLNPATKAKVESALNTEDKVQKQFMALLLLGSFIPSEQSGVVNGSNVIYSNFSEIMSSQVNNILNKLNIPVDLGFGYQQSTGGTDMFDVAVSTQLFNNRVEVSGTVGNKQYNSSSSGKSEVVGDLDIEIKIDKLGQLRAKLFSHSADENSSYLDNAQRNGAGVSFRKEYNNFKDLFRSIFSSRAKKKEYERQRLLNPKESKVIYVER